MGRGVWVVLTIIGIIVTIVLLDFATTNDFGTENPIAGFITRIDHDIQQTQYERCLEENTEHVDCSFDDFGVFTCLERTCESIESTSFNECFPTDVVICEEVIRTIQVDCSVPAQECWVNQKVGCMWLPGDGDCKGLPECPSETPDFCPGYIDGLVEIIETRCALGICKTLEP